MSLNNAFSRSGAYSASAGADTKLRFCIVKKDPNGGITTGITRTTSFFSNSLNKDIEDARLKNRFFLVFKEVFFLKLTLLYRSEGFRSPTDT